MSVDWRRRPLFYAALALSAGILLFSKSAPPFLPELEGRTIFLGGKIVSEVESRETFPGARKDHFILDAERVWEGLDRNAQDVRGRVRVSWKNAPALSYGDVVVVEGEPAPFPGRRNPGGFDSAAYWERQGVHGVFYADKDSRHKILQHRKGSPVRAAAIAAKRFLSEKLSRDFDKEESAFLKALFLGEKSDLEQDFKDLFLNTGTMHILAVSGFNIGFLSAVLWLFMRPLRFPRNVKLLVLGAAAWAYCLLVGWQAPVVRATLMATVFLTGKILGRKSDGLNTLGLAACVILLFNPRQLFDVGFQLSFLAVFALIFFTPLFLPREKLLPHETRGWDDKFAAYVRELFWVSFICYFATLPIVMQNFYIFTPYALIANLVVVPLGFLLFLFGLPYFLIPGAAWPLKFIILLFTKALFRIEQLPGSVLIVGKLALPLLALWAAGLAWLFVTKRIKDMRVRAVCIALLCLNVFFAQDALRSLTRRFEMTLLDVGQGDSLYFQFPKGGNLLVDGGEGRFSDKGRYVLQPYLRSKGVRQLDMVAISHPQEDHIGGLHSVFRDFKVLNVVHAGVPYESARWKYLQERIQKEKAAVRLLRRGGEIAGYPEVRVQALHPDPATEGEENINDASLVLKLTYGESSFLLTGDIQEKALRALLASGQDLKADVLKVPHHGAKFEEAGRSFVDAVHPSFSLISCGARNPFKHPRPETVDALNGVPGNRLFRTDREGAVSLLSDGKRIFLTPETD